MVAGLMKLRTISKNIKQFPYKEAVSLRGQAGDTPFILALIVLIVFGVYFTTQISPRFPEFSIISGFDATVFVGAIVTIASACVLAGGVVCAGTLLIINGLVLFTVTNTILGLLLFTPLTVTLAFVLAKLGRGFSG